MRYWARLIVLLALVPLELPLASTAAQGPGSLAAMRAGFHRPANVPFPSSNPYSKDKSALGKLLFFDPILSQSRTHSCASCHNPSLSWGDGLPRAIGESPKGMALRSPTLIDVAFTDNLGWDGKFDDLESVAFGPISNPINMNLSEAELIARLSSIPAYSSAFQRAFGDSAISRPRIEMALATFERGIVAGESPFDRWITGDKSAISIEAKRGFQLFNGKAHCSACHSGPSFTDGSFADIGTAEKEDVGRGRLFPTSEKLRYAFKTPTLRDVARRAPYMHNGSVATLADVIDLYDKGGVDRPSRSPLIKPLGLSSNEKTDLVAFLQTLTDSAPPAAPPTLPR